jgi:hypothetical protein
MSAPTYTVEASHPRPTTTGVERGVDVDVDVYGADGDIVCSGGVTLLPAADGRSHYESWGERSNWMSSELVRWSDAQEDDIRARTDIEEAAAAAAGRP